MMDELPIDSGMDGQSVAEAEAVWANLPTGNRTWAGLTTYEKALICHTLARHRIDSNTEAADLIAELVEALRGYFEAEEIDDPAVRLEELAASRTKARAALAKATQ